MDTRIIIKVLQDTELLSYVVDVRKLLIIFFVLQFIELIVFFSFAYNFASDNLTNQCYNAFVYSNQKLYEIQDKVPVIRDSPLAELNDSLYNESRMRLFMLEAETNIKNLNAFMYEKIFSNLSYRNMTARERNEYEKYLGRLRVVGDFGDYLG